MRRRGALLALLLVTLVDAVVLAGVTRNRGETEASLILTERELPIGYAEKENTGMWLRLEVSGVGSGWFGMDDPEADRPAWSTPERLAELGFDCSVPVTDPSADIFYAKALPLERYAVLEYDGESWRRWLARKERGLEDLARQVERGDKKPAELKEARERLEADWLHESRLFLIDVGRDPAALRRRYPDRSRYVVAGTIVELALHRPWDPRTQRQGDPVLRAFASQLLVGEIHVPHPLRPHLETIRRDDRARREGLMTSGRADSRPAFPRYAVTLKYGRRHEPWIADVRPLREPPSNEGPGR